MNKDATSGMIAKAELDELDQEPLVVDARAPATVQDFSNHAHTGKAYRLFKQINWAEWWDEFLNSTATSGALKYQTTWAFAKAKTNNNWEAKVIYECIGPKPEPVGENKLRVPWLGDWQRRRANGFWCTDDPVKMRFVNGLLKERTDAMEAAQALAPLLVIELARLQRMGEKIDLAFAGEPFLRDEPPTSPKNRKRFWTYFKMHKQVSDQMMCVMDEYLKLFGLPPGDADYWLRLVEISERSPRKPS